MPEQSGVSYPIRPIRRGNGVTMYVFMTMTYNVTNDPRADYGVRRGIVDMSNGIEINPIEAAKRDRGSEDMHYAGEYAFGQIMYDDATDPTERAIMCAYAADLAPEEAVRYILKYTSIEDAVEFLNCLPVQNIPHKARQWCNDLWDEFDVLPDE